MREDAPHPVALAKLDDLMASGMRVTVRESHPLFGAGAWEVTVKNKEGGWMWIGASYSEVIERVARYYGARWEPAPPAAGEGDRNGG